MLCRPSANVELVYVAAPELSVNVPSVVLPSSKVSMPVGVPAPGLIGVTVPVKLTDWPYTEGLTDEVSVVLTPALLTVWASADDVLELKSELPL